MLIVIGDSAVKVRDRARVKVRSAVSGGIMMAKEKLTRETI